VMNVENGESDFHEEGRLVVGEIVDRLVVARLKEPAWRETVRQREGIRLIVARGVSGGRMIPQARERLRRSGFRGCWVG
jgi:hypothetical protein